MTADSKRVSILMPAHNGEVFLVQAIDSVLAQTHLNWELIVVDDGSTDDTARIVAGYKNAKIRYIYQENQGQASALNRGLELAQGDYITTLDIDDWFTPNSLHNRVVFLDNNPEFDVVYGDGIYCDVNGERLKQFSQYRIGDVTGEVYEILISTPFYGTGGNVMVRKQVLDQYRIQYDESIFWCHDWDFYTRIAQYANFGCVDTIIIWYRIHEENMTMAPQLGDKRIESLMRMKYKIMNSPRFSQISLAGKYSFFFSLLTTYLIRRKDAQIELFSTDHFQSLPSRQQAQLLRLTADNYILMEDNLDFAKELLVKARVLNPLDMKAASIALLLKVYPKVAVKTIRYWHRAKFNQERGMSPHQMVRKAT